MKIDEVKAMHYSVM